MKVPGDPGIFPDNLQLSLWTILLVMVVAGPVNVDVSIDERRKKHRESVGKY